MSGIAALLLSDPRPAERSIDPMLVAAKKGDAEAFAALYDEYGGRVYAICLRMAADPVRASELVQDVFVRVWRQLGSFRGESAFGTWLHRLTVNVVLGDKRSRGRRRDRVVLGEDLGPGGPVAVARQPDVANQIDLERAVATLPTPLREVFVLHDVEGYPHAEIADLMDIPVGTCRSHLFRARRLLREELK